MGIVPGLILCTLKRKDLFVDDDYIIILIQWGIGADKVLSWMRQLVTKISGFRFCVWNLLKFFIIKMSEKKNKEIRDFWNSLFQKKNQLLFLRGVQRGSTLEMENSNPSKQIRHQSCPGPTPHRQGSDLLTGREHLEPKRPGSQYLRLIQAMLSLPKWGQVLVK